MIRLQQSAKALGSEAMLTLVVPDEKKTRHIFRALWATIHGFEERFSRFLPESELSLLNKQAGEKVRISTEMRDLLRTAKYYYKQTGGLYNPFSLPGLQRAGYVGSWPTPQKHHEGLDFSMRRVVSIDKLKLEDLSASMPSDAAIDFGGIGKGYLLDQLGDYLDNQNVIGYWLSLGGDILCKGSDTEGQPWKIGVADAQNPLEPVARITSDGDERCAVATSGTTKRKGAGWHHIIDPRSGLPATTDILTCTVVAESATAADVYAKCLVILGSKQAAKFVKEHSLPSALLQIRHNESVRIERLGSLA